MDDVLRTRWQEIQSTVAHEYIDSLIGSRQCSNCAPMFGNGFLVGLALAIVEPEYASALWMMAASGAANHEFFVEHHAKRSHEIASHWPLEGKA